MNEHDEYLRQRPPRDPVPFRWMCLLLAGFWLGIVLIIKACAQ